MASKGTILVGTIGQGVMASADDGESWTRAGVRQGMHSDCIVRTLLPHPRRAEVVYAGTDMGLYASDDAGVRWRLLDTPMNGSMVWSMAYLYRSDDGGESWRKLWREFGEVSSILWVPGS